MVWDIYMYVIQYCHDYSLALHPNKELIASGQVAGHAKKDGKVRRTLITAALFSGVTAWLSSWEGGGGGGG